MQCLWNWKTYMAHLLLAIECRRNTHFVSNLDSPYVGLLYIRFLLHWYYITRHNFFIPCPELYMCIRLCTRGLQYACLCNYLCLSCVCQLFLKRMQDVRNDGPGPPGQATNLQVRTLFERMWRVGLHKADVKSSSVVAILTPECSDSGIGKRRWRTCY